MTTMRHTMAGTFAEALLAHESDEGTALLFEGILVVGRLHRRVQAKGVLLARIARPCAPPHIGVLLDNVPDYLFWLGAGALAGATVVGINSTYRGSELARLIDHTDCQVLVTEDRHRTLLDGLELAMPASRVVQIDAPDYEVALRTVGPASADETVDPETLQLLIFTSGSTAAPKAVRCTQGRLARTGTHVAAIANLRKDDVVYPPLPLFHSSALFTAWSSAVHVGAPVVLRREVLRLGLSPRCPTLRRDVHRLHGEGAPIRDGNARGGR